MIDEGNVACIVQGGSEPRREPDLLIELADRQQAGIAAEPLIRRLDMIGFRPKNRMTVAKQTVYSWLASLRGCKLSCTTTSTPQEAV